MAETKAPATGPMAWWSNMDPAVQAAIIAAGANIGGGVIGGMGDEKAAEAGHQNALEIARMNNRTSLYGADNARYIAAQNAIGRPLQLQRERAGMGMLSDMLSGQGGNVGQMVFAPPHLRPSQGTIGNMGGAGGVGGPGNSASKFLTPEAMVNAEVPYWQNLSALNPDINANLGNVGYGAASPATNYASGMIDQSRLGNMAKQQQERDAVYGALGGQPGQGGTQQAQGKPPKGFEYDKKTGQLKKKGGGWKSKLGKIGLIAGGAIATAMTGGAASPLLAAAIGAGTGAASGALGGGGWKGALTGAALGGLTGGVGAGAGGAAGGAAAKMGLGQAAKTVLSNPQILANMGGAGIGGNVGNAIQLGSMALPGSFHGYGKGPGGLPRVKGISDKQAGNIAGSDPWTGMGNVDTDPSLVKRATPKLIESILAGPTGGRGMGQQQAPVNAGGGNFVDPNAGQRGKGLAGIPPEVLQQLLPLILGLAGKGGGGLGGILQGQGGWGGMGGGYTPPGGFGGWGGRNSGVMF